MLRGLNGLTAMVVSFCAELQPAWLPTGTVVSPEMASTFGAGSRYGLGLPMNSWHSADSAGSSVTRSSSPWLNCSFSSSLGTLWSAC